MLPRKVIALIIVLALLLSAIPAGMVFSKGKPPVESTNNLSFPVIWSEGVKMTLPGSMLNASLITPYDYNEDGIITETDMLVCGSTMAYAYAQKTTGNVWQAENTIPTVVVYVSQVDWGDSLESTTFKVGRPIRVELTLYQLLTEPMTGFSMVMLANPSSPDEVQGACATTVPGDNTNVVTYPSTEATVYSPNGKITIQLLGGTSEDVLPGDLIWDGAKWVDGNLEDPTTVGLPLSASFGGELNVGGKVIYGLSKGGWKPTAAGDYRLTFYLPLSGNAQLEGATIRSSAEESVTVLGAGSGGIGSAVVDGANNLTYIDIRVTRR